MRVKHSPKLSSSIAAATAAFPCLRFGQLIDNALITHSKLGVKKLFYMEDDELADVLDKYVKEFSNA